MTSFVSAIFLDRDGTINYDKGYVHKVEDFHFFDGVIDAMRELKTMGFALVIVTNQSGLARGFFKKDQLISLIKWINWSLLDYRIDLDGHYFCPHHPLGIIKELRKKCNCRKPKPGMLLTAQRHLHIDMTTSYMVGDKIEDMLAAKAAKVNMRVLVRSGNTVTKIASKASDWIIDSLATLPAVIKQQQRKQ
ncbi:D,D-heptose 1,7-bisphosphate phosphatase [secondary endosymbiont of Heteropsylla cubana]|uniref:D,D-heptose 1,7-bisphosphate phosphatase n=1 Tax=secondary endosymbiont of Heteropsylla cubana TaxID=134287 RepID=J3Z5Y7_9ENTR|nr:D-glycero-beta-D-manno-heptose 1,7-bisphosphate 7-phosphatase [secondary endosymbiont of Heteropsylla cubana]AFP85784.1 D,D-heptose 1,7-bisphosphate phosphatase [secondary endosymbiont of Heteropsylla cubana]